VSWSFVGRQTGGNTVNGATSGTAAISGANYTGSAVNGGDVIVLAMPNTTGGAATTASVAGFTALENQVAGGGSTHDTLWLGYRIAGGTAGSATTDSTFAVTFGATSWGEWDLIVLRSSVGAGSVTVNLHTQATYTTALPDASLAGNATDLTVWGYSGQNAALSGTENITGTGPSALSNFPATCPTLSGNGGVVGMGWGTNQSAPGGGTSGTAIDAMDFVVRVAESGGGAPAPVPVPHGGRYWRVNRKWRKRLTPAIPGPPPPLATSASAKALQRSAADKIAYLYDGSALITYWDGAAGQVAQVVNPLAAFPALPSVVPLITTAEDGTSLWTDNSSGTSSDIWVCSSDDDASGGAGPSLHVRHGSYTAGVFTWDAATVISGTTTAATIMSSITWNGTSLMVFWWDGTSGSDRVEYSWTTTKNGTSGWSAAAVFSESSTWSTIVQVTARHSAKLGATIVAYGGNTQMHYACLNDSAASPAIANWGGRAVFDQFTDNYVSFGGPQLVIDEVSGAIHCVRATPNAGGPTWTGVTYWLGTYTATGSGSVSWATRVIVDAASTATGPADIAAGVDTLGTVYVAWTTDTSAGTLKWATLASPYTSAVAGGTISTPGATPRWPHIPPVSQAQAGLTVALPVLWMDTTSAPYPIRLDTSVSLAATVSATATTLAGAGSLAASAAQQAGASLGAAGSLAAAVTQGSPATLGGAGSLGNLDVTGAPAALGGTGSLATAATQGASATMGGAGSLSSLAAQGAPAALAGTGSLATAAIQGAGASLPGTGSLAAAVKLSATVTLPGAGSLSAQGNIAGAATLGGAGSISTASSAGGVLGGQGSVTTGASLLAPATLGGSGSIANTAVQGTTGTVLGAQGSIAAPAAQGASATLSGQGSLTTAGTIRAPATLAGTGSLAAAVTLLAPATLAAAGSLAAAATQGAPTSLTGTGSLSAAAATAALATLAGAGSVAGGTVQGSTLGGTGSLNAPGTLAAPAALTGAGSLTTAATQGTTGTTVAGTGSIAATVIQRTISTLAGTGSLTTSVPSQSGQLSGTGSLNAPGSAVLPPAVLAGTGSIAATVIQRAVTTVAGAGSIAAAATQRAGAVLTGTGSLTALGLTHPPQVKGGSTGWSVTRAYASAAAVSEQAGTVALVSTGPGKSAAAVSERAGTSAAVTQPSGSSASVS
jgi:hypothetical protein